MLLPESQLHIRVRAHANKARIILFTFLSLLPAIALALVPAMNKYFKITHGPIEGTHNRAFLLAFFVIFWLLFLPLTLLRSKKLEARLKIKDRITDVILDGLTGAILGYIASLSAYLVMVFISHHAGGGWPDRSVMLYPLAVLLLGNYCWLLGSICLVIFDVFTGAFRPKSSSTGYAGV